MTTILAKIKADWLAARKARETGKATLLTTIIGGIETRAKSDGNREPTDQDSIKVLNQFLSGINEMLAHTEEGSLKHEEARQEKLIVEAYLPKLMSEDELKSIMTALVAELGVTDAKGIGKIMGALKSKHEGQYDGKAAQAIFKTLF